MNYKLINGNSLKELNKFKDNSFDSVITDPPYGLGFMGKDWDKPENIAFNKEFWKEVLRVLKPGGHILAFSGSRTYHRMAVAIEDAGFEIRDQIMWLYGSGMPKSSNLSKQIDKSKNLKPVDTGVIKSNWLNKDGSVVNRNIVGASKDIGHEYGFKNAPTITTPNSDEAKQWEGWGSSLKPAHEPIVLARKPFKGPLYKNVLENGTGALNIDESRVSFENGDQDQSTTTENDLGRFPANVIHDKSSEVIDSFPSTKKGGSITKETYEINNNVYGKGWGNAALHQSYGDSGSAARFFYGSKCSKIDRNEGLENFEEKQVWASQEKRESNSFDIFESDGRKKTVNKNNHPTVKPTDLMSYLVRLITPKGGFVLDPFNGSGSTGKAIAYLNKKENKDYKYVGIELDKDYIDISKARIEYAINNEIWLEKKK